LAAQVPVLGFSTGCGTAVTVSAARLRAAQQQFSDTENASENGVQPVLAAGAAGGGDSTPQLRKQLLRTRASLPGGTTPQAANPAGASVAEESAVADDGSNGGGQTPAAGCLGRTAGAAAATPASAPALGKAAALRR
jgi:hypothetical protein